ncbi:hypothetical protein [Bittarella massiliensis (ex Durand et al. 2017)]|uniref:hypothetical protein n=1 Tax=Bittarella massiliensis (ex Durand et al. 2017) TaxID=1720313 RepID=UPI001AA1A424|nr:hypothetical protein [Bittarella massiliensis (ex Durand et al. 2017)]MBO1679368.1 hypothetical protein [Bittarella massiliensis (ex Durand et al. 2017)]
MIYPCYNCKEERPCDREHCLAFQLMRQHGEELLQERRRAQERERDVRQTEMERTEMIRRRYRR